MKLSAMIAYFIFVAALALPVYAKDLAIVVNKANQVDSLSSDELEEIFTAEKQFWNNERVVLLMREQGGWEKELILKKIYHMSDDQLNQFWLTKIFRGELTTFPSVIGNVGMIKQLVVKLKGVISYIDSQELDNTVKVVKVNGKLPGQEGYLLKE